ncbi:hypothetical protein [Three spot gourami iridovirus]|nr:hypothetical protein [Three spot gourami iridovirus]
MSCGYFMVRPVAHVSGLWCASCMSDLRCARRVRQACGVRRACQT